MTLRRTFLLLALALPLTACLQDKADPAAPRLQAVEARDESGTLTAVTLLDRDDGGHLVRVRHYVGAGADDTWRTDDDELQTWSRCRVVQAAPALLDPLLELTGHAWLGGRFLVRSCAIEERASLVSDTTFNFAGADGRWFTDDDGHMGTLLLERTATGNRLTLTPPPAVPCDINCEGLSNIVYDPYAGLETVTTASYGQEGGTRLLQRGDASYRYTFDTQGRLLQKTVMAAPGGLPASGNVSIDLFLLGAAQMWDRFEYREDGTVLASRTVLFASDAFGALQASTTGALWLALMGYTESPVEIDGQTYYEVTPERYRLVEAEGRLQRLERLNGPGDDGSWGTADDGRGPRLEYRYATP